MFAATRLLHSSAYACVGHATLRLLTKNASRCSRRGSTYAYNPPRTGRSAFGQSPPSAPIANVRLPPIPDIYPMSAFDPLPTFGFRTASVPGTIRIRAA